MMDHAIDLSPAIQNPLQVLRDVADTARRYSSLVGDAFALTLQADRGATRAIGRLKLSRGSTLAYLYNQSADLSGLEVEYEAYAKRFLELRQILRENGYRTPLQSMEVEPELVGVAQFHEATVAIRELLRETRKQPGFERVLQGPNLDQIRGVLSNGLSWL